MTPLRAAERGIWAGAQLASDKALYNTAECLLFSGKISVPCLEASIRQAVREAECLSSFYEAGSDGRGVRIAAAEAEKLVSIKHVRLPGDGDLVEHIRSWAEQSDLPMPFLLSESLPCRFAIFENDSKSALYMAAHHVALDGYGYALFWGRLAQLYSAMVQGETIPPGPFASLKELQEESLNSEAARQFWLEKLSDTIEPPSISRPLPPLTRGYNRALVPMAQDLWTLINQFAASNRLTWADVIIANLATLIRRRTGINKLVLGLPVMNRSTSAALQTPCMQMNIVPLCLEVTDADDLLLLAGKVSTAKKAMHKFQDYRYETMQRDMQKLAPRERLFGAVVNILPFAAVPSFGEISAGKEVICAGPVVDFALTIHYLTAKVAPQLEFSGHLLGLPPAELTALAGEFFEQLGRWLSAPTTGVQPLLAAEISKERARHLIGNDYRGQRPAHVLDLISEQAQRFPLKTAIEAHDRSLTYAELIQRVEVWAGGLVANGVKPGDPVGVLLERSAASMVAMLAIMRAGAVYVPLDAKQPASRQRRISEILPLKFIVADSPVEITGQVLRPEQLDRGLPSNLAENRHELAYVLFTSGSTGEPKGVAITHDALAFFVSAANERYRITAEERVLQFAPLFFDASIEEIFLALCHGATLVVRDDKMLDSFKSFAEAVESAAITVLDLPTAFWNEWVEALSTGQSFLPRSVHTVIIGGEAVHPGILRKWCAAGAKARLINSYGPTETTIVATTVELKEEHASLPAIPIGLPLPGVRLLILDTAGRPALDGELWILGPTVGSHYLGYSDALEIPLQVGDRTYRAYRTGDRVRFINNTVTYLGRIDHEFKISGYRVQPQEVEARLLGIAGVREACVEGIIDEQGRRRLVGFVAGCEHLESSKLRHELRALLPAPMVPGRFIVREVLPKTSAGKIDRVALVRSYHEEREACAPSPDPSLRAAVYHVWQEVLGLEEISPQDDFFSCGGDSLQAMQVALYLSQRLKQTIAMSSVMEYPAFEAFCGHLQDLLNDPLPHRSLRLVDVSRVVGAPKVYFFPGIWATAAQFADLLPHLSNRLSISIVEASLLGFTTVGDWAHAALELLEEQDGPVRLVGHSFGGCVAYEVGRLLERKGVKVELCLLDAYFLLDRSNMRFIAEEAITPLLLYRPSGSFKGWTRRIYAATATHFGKPTLEVARVQDSSLFTGPGDVLETAGDHFSMLGAEHAASLAGLIPWT